MCLFSSNRFKAFQTLFLAALICLVFIPILLWNTSIFTGYMNILTPMVSFTATCLIIYAARWSYKNRKDTFKPWVVLAVAMLAYSFATAFYFVFPNAHVTQLLLVSDVFYLGAYFLLISGIILFIKMPFKIRLKDFLDAVIVMVSGFFIVWFLLVWSTVEPSQPDTISLIISIYYLFLDLMVLLTVLILLFNENKRISELPIVLFSLGVFFQIMGDMIYAYYSINPVLVYKWVFTVFYTSNSFFIIMAVLAFMQNIQLDEKYTVIYYRNLRDHNILISYLPLILVLFTYTLLIITTPDKALIWGVGVVVVLVIIRQIVSLNEIKRNKETISQRKEQLSFITSNMLDLITESDEKGIIKYVSPSAPQVLGYSPDYMLGKSVYDFIHPDDQLKMKQSLKKSINSSSSVRLLHRSKNAEDKYIWFESMGKPIFENSNLKGFIYSSRDVTARKQSEEIIKKSLMEKETLLNEIHHRVNNNLQIIISLLNLQAENVVNEQDQELFLESQNRVQALAMIHEKLYQSDNLSSINFSDYVRTLIGHLMYIYSQNMYRIELDMDIDEIEFNIETSVPCGLIINELVSNSLKHAFPQGRNGKIWVQMHKLDGEYILRVGDDGIGFSESQRDNSTLGLNLVYSLVDQLDGTIKRLDTNGTVYKIVFNELKYKKRI